MAKTIIGEAVESGAAERAEGRVTGERLRKKAKNLDGLARLVGGFIPPEIFAGERDRVYSPWVTFVAFLGQVLTRESACRNAVRQVQAWCLAERRPVPDENTSGYCQARARLARRELLRVIAADLVPRRPDRSEPRAVKRRPKSYQLLSKPRHEMVVSPSRNQK
jgi:hypothetical protein